MEHNDWYAMLGPDGSTLGYGRLDIAVSEDGALTARWELRLQIPGHAVEEDRTITLDADHRVQAAGYRSSHKAVALRREGASLVGESVSLEHGTTTPLAIEAGEDAITDLGFVLAVVMPRSPGTEWTRRRVNDAEGGRDLGPQVFRVVGPETLAIPRGRVEATRVDVLRDGHHPFHVWVGPDGAILQTAGGGLTMQVRDGDTSHLYSRRPSVLTVVDGGASALVLEGTLEGRGADEVFQHFTEPARITRWWANHADVEPRAGGRYRLQWHAAGWTLDGTITVFEPPQSFGFTWAWAHEADFGLTARVDLAQEGDDTRVRVVLEPYDDASRRVRHSHAAVWRIAFDELRTHLEESCTE